MAWVDSEQMWRMEKQKRTLSAISNDSDYSFSDPEDNENGEHFLTATLKEQSHVSPVKAARLDQLQMENMIVCLEPPCHRKPRYFPDLSSYEQHQKQFHTLVCLECHLHFPTERILSIHLEERHNPFVEAQRARHSYKYKCYVEGCNETFSGVVRRNTHLRMFHYYPANYFFGVVKFGIDKRDQMLTWDTFQNSWGKTSDPQAKQREKRKGQQKEKEKMVVDERGMSGVSDKGMVGSQDTEMGGITGNEMEVERIPVEETNFESTDAMTVEEERETQGTQVISDRSSVKRKLPIFAFQHEGIAVNNRQWRERYLNRRQNNWRQQKQSPYRQQYTSQHQQQQQSSV